MLFPKLAPAFFAIVLSALAADTYKIDTIAGSDGTGDGGIATSAAIGDAEGVCIDPAGNIYFTDTLGQRVRKITPAGIISSVAGTGVAGFKGDGGPAIAAELSSPYGLALDTVGSLYIADLGNNRVRKIAPDGSITTVAGNGPDTLLAPRNVVLDDAGNLYISEFDGHRIRRVGVDGTVSVFAGTGIAGADGDGGAPTAARLDSPAGMAFDRAGNLYVADSGNDAIRKIGANRITTVLGGAHALAPNQLYRPTAVIFDSSGNLYIADSGNHRIQKLVGFGAASTVAGSGRDLAIDAAGNLVTANGTHVQRINAAGTIVSIAGGGSFVFAGDGGPATAAVLNGPGGVAIDSSGAVWIADGGNGRIRKVSASGGISTVVDQLTYPTGVALDASGNLLIADQNSDRIRKLNAAGVVSTLAGIGMPGYNGDLLPAIAAQLFSPAAVAADAGGNLYIADAGNQRVRRVNAGGWISTVAGNGSRGVAVSNSSAISASLDTPRGVCVDAAGNLYIADTANNAIRKVSLDGIITTLAGRGTAGFSGDGGPASAAQLTQPRGIAMDAAGNLWIADTGNHRVRRITPDGTITTIAGNGQPGFSGDGDLAASAQLQSPAAIAIDASGQVWIADTGNNRIRKLTASVIDDQKLPIAVMNAASLQPGPVAPGSIVAIFGAGLGPLDGVIGQLATQVAGVQVLFDGRPAPLFYVQDGQINAEVPFETFGQTVSQMEVLYQGQSKGKASVPIAPAAPGLFNVILNEDGSLNASSNPARRGSIVTLYATGGGQTSPGGVDGKMATAPFPKPILPVVVNVSLYAADVLYGGDAPGFSGLMQINARVPVGFATGMLPVSLVVGEAVSPAGVSIAVK
jgi:uncharacterized protein (TIGR03437 family)